MTRLTGKVARFVAAAVALLLLAGALRSDPAKLAGRFYSDGATYYTMAWSLVADFDLEYEAADLARVQREFPNGPEGIFLKRSHGGVPPSSEPRIYFGKAMTYPVLAAPFVAILGSRGFYVFNVLCLLAAWTSAFLLIRPRTSEARAIASSAALILLTVAPVYVVWIQPETLNLSLTALALLAWSRDRPLLSALIFGVAGYTKPTHLLMAAPLGFAPLFDTSRTAFRRLVESGRRGIVMVGCSALLFGLNTAVTGEWNYQGGERKTFVSEFPFERTATKDVTFGNGGEWMTTMKLGPLEEGQQESRGSGIAQAREELAQMFRANALDFWTGRYAGMLPYYAPAFLALLAFLLLGPRTKEGALGAAGLVLFAFISIWILPGPTNWYGGGGTVGNRYFMAALPLSALFLPKGREMLVTLAGAALSAMFLFPAWLEPMAHSVKPSLLASPSEGPLSYLRAERAMLNDLSLCTDAWRKKQPYDDVEGDAPLHRPGSKHGYWLYFPDDGTFGREIVPGAFLPDGEPQEGFRVKRGHRTEVLVRANEPVDWIDVTIVGMGVSDDIEIDAGGPSSQRATVSGNGSVTVRVVPGSHVMYYDSFVYSVRVRSRGVEVPINADARPTEHTMVRFALHVSPRPAP